VINTTGNNLELFVQDAAYQTHKVQTLEAGNIMTLVPIPDSAISIFVQATSTCTPISIANGLKGIIINTQATGIQNYTIQALLPTYEKSVFVYNGSNIQQLIVIEIDMPPTTTIAYFTSFFTGTKKLTFSRQLEPQDCCLMEIPNITSHIDSHNTPTLVTPTAVYLQVPTSLGGPYTLDPTGHNSFTITADNNLIPSS